MSSVKRIKLSDTEERFKRKSGFNIFSLEESIPEDYMEDPCNCPLIIEQRCDCVSERDCRDYNEKRFGYLECPLYQSDVRNGGDTNCVDFGKLVDNMEAMSNPLEDTVVMCSEEIINSMKNPRKNLKQRNDYDSLHDEISDGKNPEMFFGLRKSIGDESYNRVDPNDII